MIACACTQSYSACAHTYIEGVQNGRNPITREELRNRLADVVIAAQLIGRTDTPVVVYCSNAECQNSPQAARRLVELGYTDVYDYGAGKQDWIDAGLPTETGHDALVGSS
ncbi:hypothetical protein BH23ACT9_BH23ACT9_23380 [soil metagenome]